jgi:hypothetical protein
MNGFVECIAEKINATQLWSYSLHKATILDILGQVRED